MTRKVEREARGTYVAEHEGNTEQMKPCRWAAGGDLSAGQLVDVLTTELLERGLICDFLCKENEDNYTLTLIIPSGKAYKCVIAKCAINERIEEQRQARALSQFMKYGKSRVKAR